ncbi:hypothetical protein ACFX13_028779 [Malus domestica]
MTNEVEDLAVQLASGEISNMENGVKLIAKILVDQQLNKWGVKNILKSAWKEYGEIQINWVQGNLYVILVRDENIASKILEIVPWAVMKQNLFVKRWVDELAMEEIPMHLVPFWVQMKGIPPGLCSTENISRLASRCGELLEVEDISKVRGFLRIRVLVDTTKSLASGCWVTRERNNESWVEFQYERLQDFCYNCGKIGHASLECSAPTASGGMAGYGEWTRTSMIRDVHEAPRALNIIQGRRRQAGLSRVRGSPMQLGRGNNNGGEDGNAEGNRLTPQRSREYQNSSLVIPTIVPIQEQRFSRGSGVSNSEVRRHRKEEVENEGGQLGRITEKSRVDINRRGIETEEEGRETEGGNNVQHLLGRLE